MVFFLQRNTALLFVVIASVDVVSGISCLGNGVGNTCTSSLDHSHIACCIRTKTGASYNACCSDVLGAVGNYTDMTVDDDASMCTITGTGVGCPTTVVPGNDGSTPTNFGDKTPCLRVSEDSTCSNQQNDPAKNYGTCTNNGVTFAVCCVGTNTGTYAPGDSCSVTVPGLSISKGAEDEDSSIVDLDVVGDNTLSASISTSTSATAGVPTSISSITGVVVIVTTLLYSFFN